MSDFGELIKELALNAVEAEKPTEAVIGIVADDEPLKIKLEQKLIIGEDFIDVCSGAVFGKDSKVVLIRCSGGQRYILIDSVKGEE